MSLTLALEQFQQYQVANTSTNHWVKNGNLGVTCTRLNIVGRRSWAAPIKSGQLQRRKGEDRESFAASMRDTKPLWLLLMDGSAHAQSLKRQYTPGKILRGACANKQCMSFKKGEPGEFSWQQKAYSSVLWILLFHAPPPVPLLKKVAESYGKNFGALKLVNFWHPLSSLYMLPQVLLFSSAPFLFGKK